MEQFLLHEAAAGYALFRRTEFEEIARSDEETQDALSDPKKFAKMVKLVAFLKFDTAENALEEINAIAAGDATDTLNKFLEMNLPKKKKAYELGVVDPALGSSLKESYNCICNDTVKDLLRGCRAHFGKLVKELTTDDADKARLGLGHCYSRSKMQLDPNRQDKPILNTIALLDNLDKNINTFAMRVKEWYAWHFPEMTKIVTDNIVYAKACKVIRLRGSFVEENMEEKMEQLKEVCQSEDVADEVVKALKTSMGTDIVEMDMENIENFADQVVQLSDMRRTLTDYLRRKMDAVAPNLAALIGDTVGARLISHAGSLINLAKYPASTVQILGAEKALFRALKTKTNTPKYGLIFHSPFIGRATLKNKGRISRYLANKASIASRIDCFREDHTTLFGEKMKDQVEERLSFLMDRTDAPRKNLDVMKEAGEEVAEELRLRKKKAKKLKKKKKEEVSSPMKKKEGEEESPKASSPMKKKGGEEASPKASSPMKRRRDSDAESSPMKAKREAEGEASPSAMKKKKKKIEE